MAFRESLGVEGLSNYRAQVGFRVGTAGTNLFGHGLWLHSLGSGLEGGFFRIQCSVVSAPPNIPPPNPKETPTPKPQILISKS